MRAIISPRGSRSGRRVHKLCTIAGCGLAMLIALMPGAAQNRLVQMGGPEIHHPCRTDSASLAATIFREYGSVFAAARSVVVPPVCIFTSDTEVADFQARLDTKRARIGSAEIELQSAAMDTLLRAVEEAKERGLRITPLDGSVAGRRSFADTLRIWNSRFLPALNYWVARGRIGKGAAERVRLMPINEQVAQVFVWEADGLYFSTGKNRPIMSSVAPPGTSQHLSLLAFDVVQAGNAKVRRILNQNGWFQTVVNDTPHFTYLGVPESELPSRGLRKVVRGGVAYWIPKL